MKKVFTFSVLYALVILLVLIACGRGRSSSQQPQTLSSKNQDSVDLSESKQGELSSREKVLATLDAEKRTQTVINEMLGKKEVNIEKEKDFFAQLVQDKSVKSLTDGVCYKVLQSGQGEQAKRGTYVTFDYVGRLLDGTTFVDGHEKMVPVGYDFMVEGLELALSAMRVGDEWEIYVPSAMGYAGDFNDKIPAYSTLIFRVKLLSVYCQP